MSIAAQCPGCGKTFQAKDSLAGRTVSCPACKTSLTVPNVSEPAASWAADRAKPQAEADDEHEPLMIPMAAKKHDEDLIDMTAMVDIVFFLLIFFLTTSLQSLESVMDLPMPQSSEAGASAAPSSDPESDPTFTVVRIEDDDTFWIDGEQLFSEEELRGRLREARKEDEQRRNVMVIGNADASHGAAVKAFDAAADASAASVSFKVEEPTD